MGTELLVIGKGDNLITMILDNLSSNNYIPKIKVYNNLGLPIINSFDHDEFDVEILTNVNIDDYESLTLGVYHPKHKMKIIQTIGPSINRFVNVIHNGLDISKTSKLGRGILINSKVSIAAHTTIGDYCSINPGSNIAGNVTIGEGTTIGMGVNIIDGIKIGKNTIIGAGSLVTRDIPDNVVAYGSPCKIIKNNEA